MHRKNQTVTIIDYKWLHILFSFALMCLLKGDNDIWNKYKYSGEVVSLFGGHWSKKAE